ncbi:helix-turn-helix domain-containing protein [Waterburya agarophytonicola K14]|uniref:Helix-turn-helix domain-containing protein n=1 Tax=Waterburya agarophytonicola KI4 TaxID=2874699 RepID=A0A964BS28_9CYAN|nr:helix-turn-helix domain-containing protein [Waterburya agarophytonicola]MCC0178683.1 helix-turn-helix domain-containing protein [Waterburya agarophytonicola KI4]
MYSQQSQFNDFESSFSPSQPKNNEQLLSPFQQKLLKEKLKTNLRPEYRRRIEIMLLADRGHSQTQICSALNCSHETARYWTHIAQSGNAHRWKDLPIGRPKTVNEKYLNRLRDLVTQSPRDFGYAFRRWTAGWLSKHLAQELGIEVSERHVNRLLKQMGLSTRHSRNSEEKSPTQNNKLQKPERSSKSNIVIRNLQGDRQPQKISFSPFYLI